MFLLHSARAKFLNPTRSSHPYGFEAKEERVLCGLWRVPLPMLDIELRVDLQYKEQHEECKRTLLLFSRIQLFFVPFCGAITRSLLTPLMTRLIRDSMFNELLFNSWDANYAKLRTCVVQGNKSTLRRLEMPMQIPDYVFTKLRICGMYRNARATYSKSVPCNNRGYNISRRWSGYYREIAVLQRSSDLGRSIWLRTAFTLLRSLSELMHRP